MNTEKIKTVLLDYGGVVCRVGTEPVYKSVFDAADIESKPELFEKYWALMRLLARGKAQESEIVDLLVANGYKVPDDIEARWHRVIDTLFYPEPVILQLIEDLKSAGYQVGLLSNVWPLSEKYIRANGWYEYFDQTTLSCLLGVAKPDVEIYKIAQEKSQVSAAEILFVDDQQRNIDAAKDFGMQTMVAKSPEQIADDIRELLLK